jgi:hypothetical protein
MMPAAGLAIVALAVVAVMKWGDSSPDGGAPTDAGADAQRDAQIAAARADSVRKADSAWLADSTRIANAARTADSNRRIVASKSTPWPRGVAARDTANPNAARGGTGTTRPPRAVSVVVARLDSIRNDVDALLLSGDARATPARTSALVARLDRILPDARSAGDSARALLLKANVQEAAGDRSRACATLSQVRAIANSAADLNSVRRNAELWSC